jgi:hypothetical protein
MKLQDLPLIGKWFNPYYRSGRRIKRLARQKLCILGRFWMFDYTMPELPTGEGSYIPLDVFECVNEELLRFFNGFSGLVTFRDLIPKICKRMGVSEQWILESGYLCFPGHYEDLGWIVTWYPNHAPHNFTWPVLDDVYLKFEVKGPL